MVFDQEAEALEHRAAAKPPGRSISRSSSRLPCRRPGWIVSIRRSFNFKESGVDFQMAELRSSSTSFLDKVFASEPPASRTPVVGDDLVETVPFGGRMAAVPVSALWA